MALRCVPPPTTAQTIGRLETGRPRSAARRPILVTLPERPDIPVAALLDSAGAHAPRQPATVVPPQVEAGLVAVTVTGGIGDYRAGDVLVLRSVGCFLFGRMISVG